MSKSKKSAGKTHKYRSAITGRFIGDLGRRATVQRARPAAKTIRNRTTK